MRALAASRDGLCLSENYVNSTTKLLWQCDKGHQWSATSDSVRHRKSWCPTCSGGVRGTPERMQQIAAERGGRCLSDVYINSSSRLEWECHLGHRWNALPSNVARGSWCPVCAPNARGSLDVAQRIATERGGRCLSEKYLGSKAPMKWECAEGHTWSTPLNNVKNQGSWCPQCAPGTGERLCRVVFEGAFGAKFPKHRPEWLKNLAGNQMELDGYCEDLSLAFEHQGRQHYIRVPFFQTDEAFRRRQIDDRTKAQLCEEHGVTLIQIPPLSYHTDFDALLTWIRSECAEAEISIPDEWDASSLDLTLAATSASRLQLKAIQSIARERKGRLLTPVYLGYGIAHEFSCEHGHLWKATPRNIKCGTWCRVCAGLMPDTIEDMRAIAENRGGECLSPEFLGAVVRLEWRCAEGHEWLAAPNNIKTGTWCPTCATILRGLKRRLTIEQMQELAQRHGGVCLSTTYQNSGTKLRWRCAHGHEWESTPDNIKGGHWCPTCAGVVHLSLDDMHAVAKDRGGVCLSDKYVNSSTRLSWRCAEGHEWTATPSSIRSGSWCLQCSGRAPLTLNEMQVLAEQRGGRCLSSTYVNALTPLRWRCSRGHEWDAAPNNVKNAGSWCPTCAGNQLGTLESMVELAQERGGACLSTEYVNSLKKLEWRCGDGHIWKAAPNKIVSGQWCPTCRRREAHESLKIGLGPMYKAAEERGGQCLSTTYENNRSKLRWRCAKGHEWEAIPDSIKRGTWCPHCAGRRKTITDMQVLARERGGRCLSPAYVAAKVKLEWECEHGHRWEAQPDKIRAGRWCPTCGRKRSGKGRS